MHKKSLIVLTFLYLSSILPHIMKVELFTLDLAFNKTLLLTYRLQIIFKNPLLGTYVCTYAMANMLM